MASHPTRDDIARPAGAPTTVRPLSDQGGTCMEPEFTPPPPTSSPPAYPPYAPPPPRPRRLMRSGHERMWAGVAGGMAEYFDIDPALMRLIWVAATVVSGGLGVAVYILAWVILPRADRPGR